MRYFEDTSNKPESTSGSADDLSSEATSRKTLNDIEEDQKDTDPTTDDNASAPSPDGQDDTGDDSSKVGPM
jgi:hypothetical protein